MVSIFAFTCFSEESQRDMTYEAADGIEKAAHLAGVDHCEAYTYSQCKKNEGFAIGMNKSLGRGLLREDPYDYYLCFNNDIDFTQNPNWLKELLLHADDQHVMVPTTNYTACKEQRAKGPSSKFAFEHTDTPAVLWMFPRRILQLMLEAQDGKLFREDLGRAWGEDTYASAMLRKLVGPKPFLIVPMAWVHHHGERTSSKIPVGERMAAVKKARELIKKHGLS